MIPPVVHDVKLLSEYFPLVAAGIKTCEVRKNDRGYQPGDILKLHEFDGLLLTGNIIRAKITHVLTNEEYLQEGYCVLSFQLENPLCSTISPKVWGNMYDLYCSVKKELEMLQEGVS